MLNSGSKFVVLVMVTCFLISVGCENNHNNAAGPASKSNVVRKRSAEFQIAISPDKLWEDRVRSALKLDHQDRLDLQDLLLSRLPGNYTQEAIDDLSVLAEIGDGHAVKKLEQIRAIERENDILVPGKINSARKDAIEKIKERQ